MLVIINSSRAFEELVLNLNLDGMTDNRHPLSVGIILLNHGVMWVWDNYTPVLSAVSIAYGKGGLVEMVR